MHIYVLFICVGCVMQDFILLWLLSFCSLIAKGAFTSMPLYQLFAGG
jgi:hypothetical protein